MTSSVKIWRAIGIGLLGVVFCLALVISILLYALSKPEASSWLLTRLQRVLQNDFATELKFSKAQVNLLSGFQIQDLKIHSEAGGNRYDLEIRLLDLEYSMNWLGRSLLIKHFLIDQPHLFAQLHTSKGSTPQKKKEEGSNPEALADLILHPPIEIKAENLEIRDLDLNFQSESQGKTISAIIQGLGVKSTFSLLKSQLSFMGSLATSQSNAFLVSDSLSKISGNWTALSNWQFNLRRQDKKWLYKLSPLHLEVGVKNFELIKANEEAKSQIQLAELSLLTDTGVEAQSQDFLKFDVGAISLAGDTSQITFSKLKVNQKTPAKDTLIQIAHEEMDLHSEIKKDLELHIQSELKNLQFPDQLYSPADAKINAEIKISPDLRRIEAQMDAHLSETPVMNLLCTLDRTKDPSQWELAGALNILADMKLAQKIKSAAVLKKTGSFAVESKIRGVLKKSSDLDLNLQTKIAKIFLPISQAPARIQLDSQIQLRNEKRQLNFKSDLNFTNADFGIWQIQTESDANLAADGSKELSGHTELTEMSPARVEFLPVSFPKTANFIHHLKMDPESLHASIKGSLPKIVLNKVGEVQDTAVDVNIVGDHMSGEKNLTLSVLATQGPVQFTEASAGAKSNIAVTGLELKMMASLKQQTYFNLENFEFAVNRDLMKVHADATGNLKTQDLQATIKTNLIFPENFPEIAGQRLIGKIALPMNIAIRHGTDISVDGEFAFDQLGLTKDDVSIEGLNGQIPFSEHLMRANEQFHFTELVVQNAFERANFERLRPLLEASDQISIQKIHWQEKVYGPLIGYISIRQNMLLMNEFNLDMGGGNLYGEMFLDAYPKNLQFGILSRLTGLDLAEVLPKKYLNKLPDGSKRISARTGFVFSINKAILDGRVDITEIGSAQMITMVNLLDPQFQDDKMNKMRSLLEVGYPTSVALNFNQGYLDIDLELTALGISQHESIRSIPLSGFLLKPTVEIVSASEKGPLR